MQTTPGELEQGKRRAARRAAEWIQDGMVLGLGTGSTVRHLLDVVAERRATGEWRKVIGIPTSVQTSRRACSLGIPLSTLSHHPRIDLTIDGADEVDPELRLIKGLGGALLREKIVAAASRQMVVIADAAKCVERLGTRAPLPVEVDPFGAAVQRPFLEALGAEPRLRCTAEGELFVTDGGHWIYDCHFAGGISDPARLARALGERAGIVEHGLFLGLATAAVIAGPDGATVIAPEPGQGEQPGWWNRQTQET